MEKKLLNTWNFGCHHFQWILNLDRVKFVKCSYSFLLNLRNKSLDFYQSSFCEESPSKLSLQRWNHEEKNHVFWGIVLERWYRVFRKHNRTVFGRICWAGQSLKFEIVIPELLLNLTEIFQTVFAADDKSVSTSLTKQPWFFLMGK